MPALTNLIPLPALALALRWGLVIPLVAACVLVVVAIPAAARRGKLNQPAYGGLAMGAMLLAFLIGYLSGLRHVRGTSFGIAAALLFFVLVAAALGCLVSILLFREPPEW